MRRFIAIATIVGLASFGFAPSAQAEPFTPELEADYQLALAAWGVSSPPQCQTVTREIATPDRLLESDGRFATGTATQPPPGSLLDCELLIRQDVWPCFQLENMEHEVGHLLGYGHSDDPASIMHQDGVSPACEQEEIEGRRVEIRREVKRCRLLKNRHRRPWCFDGVSMMRSDLREAIATQAPPPTLP